MKKKLFIVILIITLVLICCTSCGNKNFFDTTWTFEEVYIKLPNGEVIHGKLKSWDDYDNSDMIQVEVNGKVYLTHTANVVLISTE